MDSLNNCWRLGQTTSFSSSTVSARKPPDLVESAAALEPSVVVVSSEMGLVTGMGPEVDNSAGRHFAKQTPYRMPSNPHRIEHQGIRAGLPQPHRHATGSGKALLKQKTAYEIYRSLVGSEMCIRDRLMS